ncbi:hypothetical protein AgCh_012061 [Apium graveolens]
MEEKCVTLNLHYDGIFKKTTYHGGKSFIGNRLDTSEFSYSVLMEYVKDYMKLTKIEGVYTKAADGWKLLTRDKELLDLVNEIKMDYELHLYVDTVIDKEVEPLVQMQPWLQQEQQRKKNKQKSPELPKRILSPRKCNMPVAETPELEEGTVSPKGTARRKLNLQGDKINGKSTGKNDIAVKLSEQPSQGINKYELLKMKRVQENRAKFDELGLGKYGTNPTPPTVQNVKGKEKDNEVSDEYVLENERKSDNDDSPKCGNFESGSAVAYIALRERQMQNLEADPMIEDVGESSLQNAQEVVKKGPKKPRGRTEMLKVHGRSANEKLIIKFSKRGQPIGDRKIRSELSNFLGILVKDHVSLTHDRYDIPAQREKYLNKTLNTLWRVHKSRVKKAHYTKYDSDEKWIQNRPHEIPHEDFKVLLKYWAEEEVQVLTQKNAARRNSYTDPHTLGRKTLAEVKEKLKTKDPNQGSPSQAKVYFKSRKHKKGRKYKTNRDAIQKRMDSIYEMLKEGNDAGAMLPSGKHGQYWLVGRQELEELKLLFKSQVVSIKTLENQIGQIANALLNRQPSTLPSDTEVLGKREAKEQQEKEVEPRKTIVVHTPPEGNIREKQIYPPPPFPKRLQKKKLEKQFEKFLEIFKKLHINVPFAEALEQMPSYTMFMKGILSRKEDKKIPIILGRPFLATGRTLIDVQKGELTIRVLDQDITFNMFNAMKFPTDNEECLKVELADSVVTSELDQLLRSDAFEKALLRNSDSEDDEGEEQLQYLNASPWKRKIDMPFESPGMEELNKAPKRLKPSIEEAPTLEHKPLPEHLRYAFLGDASTLPVIILSDLSEEGSKPTVEQQRRLNPIMKEVVKKEIIKWLDAGIIYPISDSSWVSPVQCVPKKGGITVVANEKNELIPTRTVTWWRVCMEYRKLNKATRKDHFPLAFIDQMLDRLAGHEYYRLLDGYSGYNQIFIAPKDQEKTTFTCPFGTFVGNHGLRVLLRFTIKITKRGLPC